VKRDTTRQLAFVLRQQQPPFRMSVVTGQAGDFLVEILKTQAEAEGLRVFEEEFASQSDLGGRFGLRERKIFHR
jgi:hypothetical protein